MASERLTENFKAMIILQKKIEDGEIHRDNDPKSVSMSHSQFGKDKTINFRNRFNKLKKEFSYETRMYDPFILF